MVAGRAGGGGGGVGGGSEFNTYLFTAGPTQIYTSQPFSLHCNKKFIHAAGDHHGSRQNIRPYRTVMYRVKILVLVSAAYFYHFLHFLCAEIIYPNPLLELWSYFSATCNEVIFLFKAIAKDSYFLWNFCVKIERYILLKLCVINIWE